MSVSQLLLECVAGIKFRLSVYLQKSYVGLTLNKLYCIQLNIGQKGFSNHCILFISVLHSFPTVLESGLYKKKKNMDKKKITTFAYKLCLHINLV